MLIQLFVVHVKIYRHKSCFAFNSFVLSVSLAVYISLTVTNRNQLTKATFARNRKRRTAGRTKLKHVNSVRIYSSAMQYPASVQVRDLFQCNLFNFSRYLFNFVHCVQKLIVCDALSCKRSLIGKTGFKLSKVKLS